MRILILGAGGMLGHKLWQLLPRRFPDSWATLRGRREAYAPCGLFESAQVIDGVDATEFGAVERILEDLRPRAVINCVAVTKRRESKDDVLACMELNAVLPHRLARWAVRRDARVIHFSTDCVFDGSLGGYTELSPTDARDLYGRTKALGEIAGPRSLTLRTSIIGRELVGRTELLEWFLAQRGAVVRGWRNAFYTGISTPRMAHIVSEILDRFPALEGLYQPTTTVVSKYALLLLAREAFGIAVDVVPDDSVLVRRNLAGSRFRDATGIDIPDWRTMMSELAADPTPYDRWSIRDAA